ncbi:MAG TPA: hypothetical protein PKW24_09040, partial [Clostridiales bacterium]|nr:hypothetical protein [Clostridiales bacterium]
KLIRDFLRPVSDQGFNYRNGGGVYPNLFCAHPPFQIDGNFGGTAGVAEMLLQSHEGYIEVQPALPDAWPSGSFSGLVARGNFHISAAWENKSLTRLSVTSKAGGVCKIKLPDSENLSLYCEGRELNFDKTEGGIISFVTEKNNEYEFGFL